MTKAISALEMASVLTTESVEDMKLKPGDTVQLIIKAIPVLPVKEYPRPPSCDYRPRYRGIQTLGLRKDN